MATTKKTASKQPSPVAKKAVKKVEPASKAATKKIVAVPKAVSKVAAKVMAAASHHGEKTTPRKAADAARAVAAVKKAVAAPAPAKKTPSPAGQKARDVVTKAVKTAHAPAKKAIVKAAPAPVKAAAKAPPKKAGKGPGLKSVQEFQVPAATPAPSTEVVKLASAPASAATGTVHHNSRAVKNFRENYSAAALGLGSQAGVSAPERAPFASTQRMAAPAPQVQPQVQSQGELTVIDRPVAGATTTANLPVKPDSGLPKGIERLAASAGPAAEPVPAHARQRLGGLPHGIANLAAGSTGTSSAPAVSGSQMDGPHRGTFAYPTTSEDSGERVRGASVPQTITGSPSGKPAAAVIERRFEVFPDGAGAYRWRLVLAATGQEISRTQASWGLPSLAEDNAKNESKLYQPGTTTVVRLGYTPALGGR